MKKYILSLSIIILAGVFPSSPSRAADIELDVKSAECIEDNKILIKYSIINYRDFDRPNVSIAFRIMSDEKPAACKEIIMVVPKNADGSKVYEAVIDKPCKEMDFHLESTIFHNVKRYRIENWFSGCPE
jgi:hypothetical protein